MVSTRFFDPTTTPASRSPCPLMNLVAECATRSAPSLRVLQRRRCEGVVDHHKSAVLMRKACDSGNIDDSKRRIPRRFEKDELRRMPLHSRRAGVGIGEVRLRDLNAESRQTAHEECECIAVKRMVD